jgi:hypothetical protein
MAITQTIVKIRIFSLFSIKKLFKLNLNKLVVFFTLFLFSCSNHLIQAEEVKPDAVKCSTTRSVSEKMDFEHLTRKDKKFNEKLIKMGFNIESIDYNLFVTDGTKPSAGFKLKLDKIIKKNNNFEIYFIEVKPSEKTLSAAVLTYPFCLLKIKNLDKFKVFINSK